MKIVYVIRNGFFPPFNGERVKSAALATALARSGTLTLIDLGRADYPDDPYPDGVQLELPYGGSAIIFSMLVHGHSANSRRAKSNLTGGKARRLSRLPLARRQAAAKLIAALRPDVVVADHPFLASLALASGAPLKIVHAHNVESQLAASMAAASGNLRQKLKVWRLRRIENRLLPQLDQVWAVSEPDAKFFESIGVRQARVTPNIIPDHAFVAQPAMGVAGHAVFFGWLAYPPNALAVEYLLGLAERSAAVRQLTLIGRGLPAPLAERAKANPKVCYLGYVESLVEATRDAAVILVPLSHGAGTKLKVIEALALGKPLVTTATGAEGLALVDGRHARIGELGEEFDALCVRALSQPEKYLAMALDGQRHARARFSQGALDQAVAACLERRDKVPGLAVA